MSHQPDTVAGRAAEQEERIWRDLPRHRLGTKGVVPLIIGLIFVPVIGMHIALRFWGP